jgi:adenosylhomocysteine nucleosidase
MMPAVAIVAAVAPETRAALAALRGPRRLAVPGYRAWSGTAGTRTVTVVQSGIGASRAAAALRRLGGRPRLVVSIGFAGALVAGTRAGDVVLPNTIVWEEDGRAERHPIARPLREAAHAALPRPLRASALHGALLSSPVVLASIAAKEDAARRTGAVAVEMETAGLVTAARETGAPVLVLRTILDTADVSLEGLPPSLDSSWYARTQLMVRPTAWPAVWAVVRAMPRATHNLTAALAAVLPAV